MIKKIMSFLLLIIIQTNYLTISVNAVTDIEQKSSNYLVPIIIGASIILIVIIVIMIWKNDDET